MQIHIPSFVFMSELLVAEGLYLYIAEKRSHFPLRAIGSILICLIVGLFCPFTRYDVAALNAVANFLRFFLMFALTCVCALFCFKGRFSALIALCSAGYATQHCTQRLYTVFNLIIPSFNALSLPFIGSYIRILIVFPISYFLLWLFFARAAKKNNYMEETDRKIHLISIGIVVICMGVSRISDFNIDRNTVSVLSESAYAFICSFMLLLIQFYFFHYEQKKREINTLNELLKKEQAEFKQWKENIDFINIKCHDLKQSISALRYNYNENALKEIENAVTIYNNGVKTGNRILDILLYEKGTYCEKNGIDFSYMIDGAKLSVLEDMDLYSLFSNIVTNAIEGVERLQDNEKRAIKLFVREAKGSLVIHEENYCRDSLIWKDGLPVTDKEDRTGHGYGLKSMQSIVRRMSGTMHCKVEQNIFSLTITFPLPPSETK